MTRRSRYSTEFGASLSQALAEARLNQVDLAIRIGVSPSYLNHMMTGHRRPTTKWTNIIVDELNLRGESRRQLYHAAIWGRDKE